jgi:triosephosphate isomerase
MSKRTPLIAGNWKMNKTATEGVELVKEISAASVGSHASVNVVLCPPFTALSAVGQAIEGSLIALGAQNIHDKVNGAFTGEISASMLRNLHVTHVIIGHSERRSIFGEDDAFINRKVLAALSATLKPILCVGELLAEREANQTMEVVRRQLEAGLAGVPAAKAESVIIAYEPVWAIGTGKVATPEQAQDSHAYVRSWLRDNVSEDVSKATRIIYGGSVTEANCGDLIKQNDVDGFLVGGASLKAAFSDIIKSCSI